MFTIIIGFVVLVIFAVIVFPVIADATGDRNWLYGSAASIVLQFVLLAYAMMKS